MLLNSSSSSLILGFDIDKSTTSGTNSSLSVGTEYWYRNLIALRLGYLGKEGDVEGFTQGLGLRYRGYEIDFANVPWGELGNLQRISFTTRF